MKLGNRRCLAIHALLMLAMIVATAAHAEGERIGLVLGGGGARGAAHIGVLKVLERERIPIHAIAGTSVGAIIGGLYAAGYSPEEIEQVVGSDRLDRHLPRCDGARRICRCARRKPTSASWPISRSVLPTAASTFRRRWCADRSWGCCCAVFLGRSATLQSFDDLPIPFRCVATDIGVVKPVVFDVGRSELAIRASMAVPGAFAPVRHDGKVLVDGGIVDNLPIDVARADGRRPVIVVDVGQPLAPAETVDTSLRDPAADGGRHDARPYRERV